MISLSQVRKEKKREEKTFTFQPRNDMPKGSMPGTCAAGDAGQPVPPIKVANCYAARDQRPSLPQILGPTKSRPQDLLNWYLDPQALHTCQKDPEEAISQSCTRALLPCCPVALSQANDQSTQFTHQHRSTPHAPHDMPEPCPKIRDQLAYATLWRCITQDKCLS